MNTRIERATLLDERQRSALLGDRLTDQEISRRMDDQEYTTAQLELIPHSASDDWGDPAGQRRKFGTTRRFL